ncbi:hypothetical protein EKG37_05935 [Robertmurraya yapensis]|uniref:Uncharacterized protein n=2 Tax=Bacillaceae TaxID=186817 RepID=A0A431WIM9_9BACI|nr:hypothetical protein [Bacillus yapensis]RTR35416.1 hypothetical protein EKG37_05935 [Bacillus yapensis]TKS97925.1 hypothetical protein FAR12_05935 [Bacillus yapensis]
MWEVLLTKLTALIALGIGGLLIVLFPLIDKENKHISWICLLIGGFIIVMLIYWILGDVFFRSQFFGL